MRIRRLVLVGLLAPCCAVPAIAQDGPQERPITVVETPPPPRTTSRVAQSLVDRGIRLLNSNQQQQAVDEFDAAIAIDPDIVWAWSNRGMALAQLNRAVEAEESFDRADALEPGNVVTLRGRGFLALRGNRNAEAVDYLTRSLEIEPGHAFALFYRSGARFMLGDRDEALADNDAAMLASPTWFLPYGSRASMLMMLGRREEAVDAVDAMLAAFPDAPYATSAAIQLLTSLGEDERAEALLGSVREGTEDPALLYASAQRRSPDETDLKLAELDRALEIAPDYVNALQLRAYTLWMESRLEEALVDARRMLELAPGNPQGAILTGQVLEELGRPDEARRIAAQLVENAPDDANALQSAAEIYRKVGDRAEADGLLDRIAASGITPEARIMALAMRSGNRPLDDIAGRIADMDAILAIDPTYRSALATRAWLHAREGEFARSVALNEKLVELYGADPQVHNGLAMALLRAGRLEEAEARFDLTRSMALDANTLNSICWGKVTANLALERALEECRASLAMVDHPATRDSLAMALLRSGDVEQALREFDLVLAEMREASSLFGRAIARSLAGDIAGARSDAAEARRMRPSMDDSFRGMDFEIPEAIAP